MTIARRLESRLWYLNLFVTFSLLSTLEILHISGNIGSKKKADHILEMAGQGKFCDYYL